MTKTEWPTSNNPYRMLVGQRGFVRSSRKLRLWACACTRRVWHLLTDSGRNAVEVAERYADGELSAKRLADARRGGLVRGPRSDDNCAAVTILPNFQLTRWASGLSSDVCRTMELEIEERSPEHRVHSELVRDVFGLRYRSVALQPHCFSETVVALATGIYAHRAFDRMPILADALEDAGCDQHDILHHCWEDGPHVCGCWVVDLLLGKE